MRDLGLGKYSVLGRIECTNPSYEGQRLHIWTFTIIVRTAADYIVDTTYDYKCTSDEYYLLKTSKAEYVDIKYAAELFEIYEEVYWAAYLQEFQRFLDKKDYVWLTNFDNECEIEILL